MHTRHDVITGIPVKEEFPRNFRATTDIGLRPDDSVQDRRELAD